MARIFKKIFDGGSHTYTAVSDKPNKYGLYPRAYVGVEPGQHYPNFTNRALDSEGRKTYDVAGQYKFNSEPPTKLFDEYPANIHTAFSHPTMRAHVPTLLGMALKEHPMAVPDRSLSVHSSRLAKKGLKKGIIKPNEDNPGADVTNKLSMESEGEGQVIDQDTLEELASGNYDVDFITSREVPAIEVKAAKAHIRSVLRPSPAKKLGPQFEQPELPF